METERTAWVAWSNTDRTEGKGRDYPLRGEWYGADKVAEERKDAIAAAKAAGLTDQQLRALGAT